MWHFCSPVPAGPRDLCMAPIDGWLLWFILRSSAVLLCAVETSRALSSTNGGSADHCSLQRSGRRRHGGPDHRIRWMARRVRKAERVSTRRTRAMRIKHEIDGNSAVAREPRTILCHRASGAEPPHPRRSPRVCSRTTTASVDSLKSKAQMRGWVVCVGWLCADFTQGLGTGLLLTHRPLSPLLPSQPWPTCLNSMALSSARPDMRRRNCRPRRAASREHSPSLISSSSYDAAQHQQRTQARRGMRLGKHNTRGDEGG